MLQTKQRMGLVKLVRQLTAELDADAREATSKRNEVTVTASAVSRAREVLKLRRSRSGIFPAGLFGEAAWDILLDIYVSEADGRPISIKAASIASGMPATTALRWIAVLEQHDMLSRQDDPTDGRRTMLSLTPLARSKIEEVFTA
jgi:hypothetical protein